VFFFFWDDSKKAKYHPLAPIAVEILLCRGSAQKIETESGKTSFQKSLIFLLQINNKSVVFTL
jgi:hypothetical protein